MTITDGRRLVALPTGTGTAQRYAVPTATPLPVPVPMEPSEQAPWFSVPSDDMVTEPGGSTACALCAGTGRLPDGSACPGRAEPDGTVAAWFAVEEETEPGVWAVSAEGVCWLEVDNESRPADNRTWLQLRLDALVQQLAGEERQGLRRAWRRFSATAPASDGRAVVAYDEVPPQTHGYRPARTSYDRGDGHSNYVA
jgi:hypothetical protein